MKLTPKQMQGVENRLTHLKLHAERELARCQGYKLDAAQLPLQRAIQEIGQALTDVVLQMERQS